MKQAITSIVPIRIKSVAGRAVEYIEQNRLEANVSFDKKSSSIRLHELKNGKPNKTSKELNDKFERSLREQGFKHYCYKNGSFYALEDIKANNVEGNTKTEEKVQKTEDITAKKGK